MKIIRTLSDVCTLCAPPDLPPAYFDYIENLFLQMAEALSGGGNPAPFSLEEHGYIVVLEPGDDARRLPGIGLDGLARGLLDSWPEYVERVEVGGLTVYRLLLLYDNEFGHTILSVRLNRTGI